MAESKNTKPILYLLANAFPFGTWEPYLETETNFYSDFAKVRIFSLSVRQEQLKNERRLNQPNVETYPILFRSQFVYLMWSFVVLFDINFYKEFRKLLGEKGYNFHRVIALFVFFSRAHYEKRQIVRLIKQSSDLESGQSILIYSYRFAYQAYLACLIRKGIGCGKIIARAHGTDLYEELTPAKRVPMRAFCLDVLERLYLISEHGYRYMSGKYPEWSHKMQLSRLGTLDHGKKLTSASRPFVVVTCSALVPLKRIDRLIQSLALIKDHDVKWLHFGEGALTNELEQLAETLLSQKPNIMYEFKGFVANKELLKFYAGNDVFLFVNVSTSEGIPVSIMEAQSFGIPCIATDVGGNSEIIVNQKNGALLPLEFSNEELAKELERFFTMDDNQYQTYRHQSRSLWEKSFSSERNYSNFIEEIRGL